MIGWLKAGRDAGSRKLTTLETVKNDPTTYDREKKCFARV